MVYDFVRALTRPYPGAFGFLDGKQWWIWQAALLPGRGVVATPGEILGPVVSPVPSACGQLVACGTGTIILLELEDAAGTRLGGTALSDQPWTGKRWENAGVEP
jgi:methionyl-tRNA formyltransferase